MADLATQDDDINKANERINATKVPQNTSTVNDPSLASTAISKVADAIPSPKKVIENSPLLMKGADIGRQMFEAYANRGQNTLNTVNAIKGAMAPVKDTYNKVRENSGVVPSLMVAAGKEVINPALEKVGGVASKVREADKSAFNTLFGMGEGGTKEAAKPASNPLDGQVDIASPGSPKPLLVSKDRLLDAQKVSDNPADNSYNRSIENLYDQGKLQDFIEGRVDVAGSTPNPNIRVLGAGKIGSAEIDGKEYKPGDQAPAGGAAQDVTASAEAPQSSGSGPLTLPFNSQTAFNPQSNALLSPEQAAKFYQNVDLAQYAAGRMADAYKARAEQGYADSEARDPKTGRVTHRSSSTSGYQPQEVDLSPILGNGQPDNTAFQNELALAKLEEAKRGNDLREKAFSNKTEVDPAIARARAAYLRRPTKEEAADEDKLAEFNDKKSRLRELLLEHDPEFSKNALKNEI
jgi:hypothetical protein